jgi:conjugal transfer pilus assembly protein TraA
MKTNSYVDLRIVALLAMLGLPAFAFAGTTGTEFLTFYTWITGIVSGYFGRAVSIAAVAIGAMISVAKSNPIPILVGIGFAVFLSYAPTVINGILTATI